MSTRWNSGRLTSMIATVSPRPTPRPASPAGDPADAIGVLAEGDRDPVSGRAQCDGQPRSAAVVWNASQSVAAPSAAGRSVTAPAGAPACSAVSIPAAIITAAGCAGALRMAFVKLPNPAMRGWGPGRSVRSASFLAKHELTPYDSGQSTTRLFRAVQGPRLRTEGATFPPTESQLRIMARRPPLEPTSLPAGFVVFSPPPPPRTENDEAPAGARASFIRLRFAGWTSRNRLQEHRVEVRAWRVAAGVVAARLRVGQRDALADRFLAVGVRVQRLLRVALA